MQLSEPVPPEKQGTKIFQGMREDSTTGPDVLPKKILRECANVLAKTFRMIALLILHQGLWPRAWMIH